MQEGCISCDTLTGKFKSPGGIVYENDYWIIVMRVKPMLAGQSFIVLKRHCENFNDLSLEELHSMSETMQLLSRAYQPVLQPVKVHFGIYGEVTKHIHIHVLPRTSALPAGNNSIRYLKIWHTFLRVLGMKKPMSDDEVAAIATQLRAAFDNLS